MAVASDQILMGLTTSALCGVGLYWESWLLAETRKGQRLVSLCGAEQAAWVLRLLLTGGLIFGLSLAAGVVNPIRWESGWHGSSRVRSISAHRFGIREGTRHESFALARGRDGMAGVLPGA